VGEDNTILKHEFFGRNNANQEATLSKFVFPSGTGLLKNGCFS